MANVNKAKEAAQKAAQSLGLAQARVILAEAAERQRESKKRNTRLVNIGIVIEQQMKSDPTLLSRVESGVLTAFGDRKAVLEAFGLEGDGESCDGENWFQQLRRESAAAAQAKSGGAASASISGDSSSGSTKGSSAAKDASPASKPGASPAASGNGTSPSKPSTNGTGAHPSAS
jgi:hypothetical protein